ncbi:hypothetical protein GUJ93_ZPchr0002g26509 [Zizania palustris]|uniref:Uncharacterized protein n=1 Tax=Zizania palustris TaxID=103762 RepID=A0A8J5VC60_ZIZPA|nr:hypothetical protein GUJ93_ZPchr0002g26509 [Zizania palustris]
MRNCSSRTCACLPPSTRNHRLSQRETAARTPLTSQQAILFTQGSIGDGRRQRLATATIASSEGDADEHDMRDLEDLLCVEEFVPPSLNAALA